MITKRIFLALILQFFLATPAFAWSFFDDFSPDFRDLWHCDSQQLPVQSEESSSEEEEEEEPDCE